MTGQAETMRMTSLKGFSSPPRAQRGVALVVSIILLIVITLMGLTAVRGTIMQQKMTSNFYDRQLAFQASEAAIRQAESVVQASPTVPGAFLDCSSTAAVLIKCLADPLKDPNALAFIVPVLSSLFSQSSAPAQPQYIIEYLGYFPVPPPKAKQLSGVTSYGASATTSAYFYRLTAWSLPGTVQDRASVTLQTVYMR